MGVPSIRTDSSRFATPNRQTFRSPIDKAKAYEVVWQQVAPVFEAARSLQNAEFVYFIGEPDNGPLKIGHSKDPVGRLRTMQTGNSRRLRIEHVLVGNTELEKLLHEIWTAHAIVSLYKKGKVDTSPGTEWFEPSVRDQLEPIIRTAAEKQIELLGSAGDVIEAGDLERVVREAHGAHDFVMHQRHVVLRLGSVGVVPGHITRI